ncbi:hypothetical protein [Arthrobacter yangruifuii]|uniref:hypothetical protein n=1 Tax=Arthrobacter yangruifuii TaxID=2606616 RepID=UPI0011B83ECC|nr:hypothetical protein [Arthrobacter yangruifuii]
MKKSAYAAIALVFAVVTSGCGSDADASVTEPSGTSTLVEASASPVIDPLDRLPAQPFGVDAAKIVADPAQFGIQWQMGEDQSAEAVAEALTVFLQVQWLANERQIYIAGPDRNKIQGSLKDAEHFVAPEHLEPLRKAAADGLAYTALHEKEGDDTAPPSEQIYYPFHQGEVGGGPSDAIPFDVSSGMQLTPRISHVFGRQEGHPVDINIRAYLDYEVTLVDGRRAVVSYPSWYGMRNVDGEWKVDGWTFNYHDAEPTVTTK